jgi:capsular polysaccharide transport system permease protein
LKSSLVFFVLLLKNRLFVITVLVPTLLSIIYYGFIATDVYTSESRFVVRSPQRQQNTSVLGSILSGSGFTRSQDDALSVHDFVMSRDALRELEDKLKISKGYGDGKVDFVSRFPGIFSDNSFEEFHRYFGKQIHIQHDSSSNISTLRVHAFSAEQAYDTNELLLVMSERLVNQINDRGRQDLVKFAEAEALTSEKKAKQAALELASFRNQRAVFDPDRQSALLLQQIGKLQDELIATKIQLAQITSLSPDNPQISSIQRRATTLKKEIDVEMAKIASTSGNSLTNKSTDFERLSLEKAFADKQLASAMASLENARNEAVRKTLYLERIVQPNKPDVALEPRRIRNVLSAIALGLIAWGILSMLLAGLREHQD